jgi:F420-dependent oxidoreductase-like protein
MTQIGLMLEGQDGLNWERWQRILQAAEELGFQCVFRSDHFTNAAPPEKDSLECWVSLTYAASHTKRIEFGPLVSPTTFRHPAMLVRMAAAVSDLSGGRLVLGMGAGWQEREHTMFDVPFYDFSRRYEMLVDALEITSRLLFSDGRVSYEGKHFSLNDAVLLPRPAKPGHPPILIGGNGPTKTLPLAAKYAEEWNGVFIDPATYRERSALLDDLLRQNGREPGDVKRSLMNNCRIFRTQAEMQSALNGRGMTLEQARARGQMFGTPSMIVDQLGEFVQAGVQRFMLQWLDLDDMAGLELMGRDVLPQFEK